MAMLMMDATWFPSIIVGHVLFTFTQLLMDMNSYNICAHFSKMKIFTQMYRMGAKVQSCVFSRAH